MMLWFLAIPLAVGIYLFGCWHERRGWQRRLKANRQHYREELTELLGENRRLKSQLAENRLPDYLRRSAS